MGLDELRFFDDIFVLNVLKDYEKNIFPSQSNLYGRPHWLRS